MQFLVLEGVDAGSIQDLDENALSVKARVVGKTIIPIREAAARLRVETSMLNRARQTTALRLRALFGR